MIGYYKNAIEKFEWVIKSRKSKNTKMTNKDLQTTKQKTKE